VDPDGQRVGRNGTTEVVKPTAFHIESDIPLSRKIDCLLYVFGLRGVDDVDGATFAAAQCLGILQTAIVVPVVEGVAEGSEFVEIK
jgi:hypothetical protein